MKKSIIAATALIIMGLAMFAVTMTVTGWDFTKLSTLDAVKNTYFIEENFTDIEINADTTDVTILPSKDDKVTIICEEDTKLYHTVEVVDGVLKISDEDTREWYDHIGIFFGNRKVTVYLPEGEYGSLNIELLTGDVKISEVDFIGDITMKSSTGDAILKNVECSSISTKSSTGDAMIKSLSVDGKISIERTTGDVKLESVSCASLFAKANTGDVIMKDVDCAGDIKLERTTGDTSLTDSVAAGKLTSVSGTGDIMLSRVDAGEIYAKTSTGNVIGSLMSEKIFITKTSTGDIKVPSSTEGGRCEVITSTGDIKLTFAK